MADSSENDPLARMQKPFLALLGFVWLLTLGLLMFHLNSQEWGGLDGNSLILLGILLGIALLPFVSQFSVAGLFEFRRDITKLRQDVEAVKNDLSSFANATATANQDASASQTQKMSVDLSGIADLLVERITSQSDHAGEDTTVAAGPSTAQAAKLMWRVGWVTLRSAFLAHYRILRVSKDGLSAVLLPERDLDAAFDAAVRNYLDDAKGDPEEKKRLERLLSYEAAVDSSGELDTGLFAEAFEDLAAATNALWMNLIANGALGAAALREIQSNGELSVAFFAKVASELPKLEPDSS